MSPNVIHKRLNHPQCLPNYTIWRSDQLDIILVTLKANEWRADKPVEMKLRCPAAAKQ